MGRPVCRNRQINKYKLCCLHPTHVLLLQEMPSKLTNIWKSKDLKSHTKIKLFRSYVIPVLTYVCESWKSSTQTDKKLDSSENKCLRKLLNIKWSDFISNNIVRDKTNQEFVSNIVRKRRWKYLGNVLRSDEKRLNRHFEEQSYKKVLRWNVTPYKTSNY
jgi:hypothetical protein